MATVTQADVAREAGVSRGLVSLALADNPNVAKDTRARILEVAQKLGYTRNLGAAMLAAKTSPVVGIVLPNLENPFFESVVSAIQKMADTRQMLALTATGSSSARRERQVIESFQGLRASGVVVVSPTLSHRTLRALSTDIPLCLVGTPAAGGNTMGVHIDEVYAANLAVNHLLEHGFTHPVFFSLPQERANDPAVHERVAAYREVCENLGKKPHVQWLYDPQEIRRSLAQLQAKRGARGEKLGVITHNDQLGIDVITSAQALGLVPGKDLGVVGFDNTFYARRPEYDLSSIDQDVLEMARCVFDLFEQDPAAVTSRDVVVKARLAVRGSSGAGAE